MGIFNIFSRRQKQLRGEFPDVYQYENLPQELRVQLIHIFQDALGNRRSYNSPTGEIYRNIHQLLCREYGLFFLSEKHASEGDFQSAVLSYFLETQAIERALDVIEVVLQTALQLRGNWHFEKYSSHQLTAEEAISESNRRFRDHGVGFQFENGEIVRVDSQYLHQEAVRPALHLLNGKEYDGANREFLRAHEHYRHGRLKEAISEAAKSLESTLKIIGARRKWKVHEPATAKSLLDAAYRENLIPSYLHSEFNGLRSTLEAGVPSVRNKVAGHGQGSMPIEVPTFLASYILHITAAAIIFIIEADRGTAG